MMSAAHNFITSEPMYMIGPLLNSHCWGLQLLPWIGLQLQLVGLLVSWFVVYFTYWVVDQWCRQPIKLHEISTNLHDQTTLESGRFISWCICCVLYLVLPAAGMMFRHLITSWMLNWCTWSDHHWIPMAKGYNSYLGLADDLSVYWFMHVLYTWTTGWSTDIFGSP
jgi:ABC-type uncharacterized transport system permease subunit